jgi:CBS domain-containing protein
MAEKARDIMSTDCTCVGENDTLVDAARLMKEKDVGALPICGEDNRLKGMLTDRDIVVGAIAEGKDPSTTKATEAGSTGEVVTIGADDSIDEAMRTMQKHEVRRLPVIDGHDLVGMIAFQDLAEHAREDRVGRTVEAITD